MKSNSANKTRGCLFIVQSSPVPGLLSLNNASDIAHELHSHGFCFKQVFFRPDHLQNLVAELENVLSHNHFLIVFPDSGAKAAKMAFAASSVFRKSTSVNDVSLANEMVIINLRTTGSEDHDVLCYFICGDPRLHKNYFKETILPQLKTKLPHQPRCWTRIVRIQQMSATEVCRQLQEMDLSDLGMEWDCIDQLCETWVTLSATTPNLSLFQDRIVKAETRLRSILGRRFISSNDEEPLEETIGGLLRRRHATLAVAESCTGGLLSARITRIPGASDYFDRSFITYSNRAKISLLKVPQHLLSRYGAVSAPTASAMAQGARLAAGVDVALAITGIAGPSGGSDQKPVGTVFTAYSDQNNTIVMHHLFKGTRKEIQEQSAHAALVLLWRQLSHD